METNVQDLENIKNVIEQEYFEGIYEGDIIKLAKIYHPGALLFGDIKGEPYAKTLDEYLSGVQNRVSVKDSGKPFKGTIVSVDVVNSIAVAKLEVKMYDFNYTDLLSLHKMSGQWLIVNKMLTDVSQ